MRIVTEKHIRHLPVVTEGEVKGMVSIGDLVKAIIATQAYTIDQLQTYIGAGG
jgi:CBS domain-containing protein